MNTTENNKIIVEFMKWDILNDMTYSKATKGKWVELDKLKFHSNWNWLMEVVEKIESLEGIGVDFYKGCIDVYNEEVNLIRINRKGLTKIEAVYNACVEFIKWYSKNAVKN